ncbi:FtsX-like permease family protein [Lysinibacillus fusiformis]|uniref:FtsX-like permease family protein n=1 Tax=Lysinibacillus fusiformis TaxID=28031 RepID=UPI003BA25425
MLIKLTVSGIKSKAKDYIVLLSGLIMSIAIFYMFQTLALNEAFLNANSALSSIGNVFHVGSFLLAIITLFYIFFANSYLLSLRKKELGMFATFGVKKYKVVLLVFIETLIIGVISLIVGIIVGIGLAQGVGMLLINQLDITVKGYRGLYGLSIIVTLLFFMLLFIGSGVINGIKLSRSSILHLVHGETFADTVLIKGKRTGLIAVLSIVFLSIGYGAMFNIEKLKEQSIMIAMLFTTAGTYLCFESVFPFLIKTFKKYNKRGLNAFTLAQVNFRINALTKMLATVAMLIALGAGAITGGMAIKNDVIRSTEAYEIYDTVIYNPTPDEKKIIDNIDFTEKAEYQYKVDDSFVYYIKEELEKNPLLLHVQEDGRYTDKLKYASGELEVGAISQDIPMLSSNVTTIPEEWSNALNIMSPSYLDLNNKPIKIIDLKQFNELPAMEEGFVFNGKTYDFISYLKEWETLDKLQEIKYPNIHPKEMFSKFKLYTEMKSIASGVIFMGFFLGIAFLAMMASCLMFKILSGASNDVKRYEMLRKLGVRRGVLSRSIYKELFILFLFPAIVGIIHVLFGMSLFNYMVSDPYHDIWLPIFIFFIIYTIYYLITVKLYKRIVLPKMF